jgi:hypothetical protein
VNWWRPRRRPLCSRPCFPSWRCRSPARAAPRNGCPSPHTKRSGTEQIRGTTGDVDQINLGWRDRARSSAAMDTWSTLETDASGKKLQTKRIGTGGRKQMDRIWAGHDLGLEGPDPCGI